MQIGAHGRITLRTLGIFALRALTLVAHFVVLLSIFVSGLAVPPWFLTTGLALWGAGVVLIVRWWHPHPERLLVVPGVVGVTYWTLAVAADAARLFPPP